MYPATVPGVTSRSFTGILAICCFTLASCAAKSDRGPQITLLDFKTQNVERLHSGLERLVGEDSAGLAAMEYVRNYEDDIAEYYPVTKAAPEPKMDPDSRANWWGREWTDFIYREWAAQQKLNPQIPPVIDPATRTFISFLESSRVTAMTDLRKNNEEFLASGAASAAKMGLVNAYVATTAAPAPNDLELIVDLVEPMLEALTPR